MASVVAMATQALVLSKTENCPMRPSGQGVQDELCSAMLKKLRELGNSLIRLGIMSSKLFGRRFETVARKLWRNRFLHNCKAMGGPEHTSRPGVDRSGREVFLGPPDASCGPAVETFYRQRSPVRMYFLLG